MSKCTRCGVEAAEGGLTLSGVCPGVDVMACRDRQIAALQTDMKWLAYFAEHGGMIFNGGETVNDMIEHAKRLAKDMGHTP